MANINLMDDRMIVEAILMRDQKVTQQYLYIKCFPLFKSIYDNYYTDSQSCLEFINDIYIHLLTPNKTTGMCKLQTFRFGSTLTTWLKMVAVYYCYERYRRKQKISFVEHYVESGIYRCDRLEQYAASVYIDKSPVCFEDIEVILNMMPNKRYRTIIKMRYIECMSNEETAAALHMTMDNFYNKHMRAKKQFIEIFNKEEKYGKKL